MIARAHSARFGQCIAQKWARGKCVRARARSCEWASVSEGERSRARMHVTHVNNAYRGPCASLPESRSFSSQPTYYLFIRTVPGWSATWRNRLREFAEPAFLAQAPSELCFHSFRFGLSIPHLFPSSPFPALLSPPFGPLFWAFSLSFHFSFFLYSHSILFSSFFKLIHPLLSFLEHQGLLSFYRVIDPPPLAPFSSPHPWRIPLLLSLLCNQNNNNLLRNCFDCSSIWVTTGYPRLCVGIDHLVIHRLRFSGRKGEREAAGEQGGDFELSPLYTSYTLYRWSRCDSDQYYRISRLINRRNIKSCNVKSGQMYLAPRL